MATARNSGISHALSTRARRYLASVWGCRTREKLLELGEPDSSGFNQFEGNLPEGCVLDEEIAEYLKAVKKNREPYDPAEHEIEVKQADDKKGWIIWFCGDATGGEWESIYVEDPRPSIEECESLFMQFVTPRGTEY